MVTYNFNVNGMDGFIQADYQHDSAVDIRAAGDLNNANLLLGARGFRERKWYG